MSLPTSTASGAANPPPISSYGGPAGWYLLQYVDGSIALVFLKNHIFQWGKKGAPAGHGEYVPYLIGTTNDPNAGVGLQTGQVPASWFQRLNSLEGLLHITGKQAATLAAMIDGGMGQSVLIAPGGHVVGGDASHKIKGVTSPGIGAQNTGPGAGHNPIVNAANAVGSVFSGLAVFGSLSFWKGIGLVLAGAAILVFAALEFKKLA